MESDTKNNEAPASAPTPILAPSPLRGCTPLGRAIREAEREAEIALARLLTGVAP